MRKPSLRTMLVAALAVALVVGGVVAVRAFNHAGRNQIVAYFDNSNGLFIGDEVRILGVPVGAIETIEPQPERVKVTFWIDAKHKVPADAKAVIVSPQLVTARAIQLTPAYESGPVLDSGAEIPLDRTAVPLEWDDLRTQLEKLTDALAPTQPGGVSTLGQFVNTAADNLRGQGANIRETVTTMGKAMSALGDHSDDTFSTLKNLSVVVTALEDSSDLLAQLNRNMAAVTGLVADDPGAVSDAVNDLNSVVAEATQFVKDNREAAGIATEKLASISTAVHGSLDDIKQALHAFPNAAQNFANVYQPSQAALTGMLAVNNLADPVQFLCGSVEAASRLNSVYSSKLCAQYLAPIVKNRQMNFPPLGENLFVGQQARPNEITYSENWLRPDYVPPQVPAEQAGLPGMLLPGAGG
ncbi:MCE family protein [Mycolicibacterium confluentis]|uniref:Mce family protein Mce3D n=1 Tax=Mycolicibacterium confluentis TaxID=28047 RepID=A0A7I7Y096_9MYCO|nr:MCE family protein [Mycolicibacterium confluentis]MCV7319540.1 MCE family protein [Mycolicibacterium confluentis]ORV34164.1 mammalian cell entry protein [Mycolicibacterium confluentis]BBZ34561.1 Mce family protein Mce3D [Mycolicibacterium confluentis]